MVDLLELLLLTDGGGRFMTDYCVKVNMIEGFFCSNHEYSAMIRYVRTLIDSDEICLTSCH